MPAPPRQPARRPSCPLKRCAVPRPSTAAFLFGDAVYEVMAGLWRVRVWLEREHMDRLRRSLGEIRIQGVDFDRLTRRMHETIQGRRFSARRWSTST